MKVAAVQITTSEDIDANYQLAVEKIREAADNGAKLIVLPEATMQAFATGRLDTNAQELDDDFASGLLDLAQELDVYVVAGMFRPADTVEREDKTIHRVYNTALVVGPDLLGGYDKIHTYDAFDYSESDTVKAGENIVTFKAGDLVVGVAVCYDIRFPDQFKELARNGAQVIVRPHQLGRWSGQARTVAFADDRTRAGLHLLHRRCRSGTPRWQRKGRRTFRSYRCGPLRHREPAG